MIGLFRLPEVKLRGLPEAVRPPHEYDFLPWKNHPQNKNHKFILLDFLGRPKLSASG